MNTCVPFRYVTQFVDVRNQGSGVALLSVSQYRGVVPRDDLTDREARADDLSRYKVCTAGDIVLNRMSAYQGALGLAPVSGVVSPDYTVIRPGPETEGRYLTYLMRSSWFVGEMTRRIRGIGSVDSGQVRTPRINNGDLAEIRIPLPPLDVQRRIADFLDDQVKRLDEASRLRARQFALTAEQRQATVDSLVLGRGPGDSYPAQWSPFGQVPSRWAETRLRSVPCTVATGPFGSQLHADEYVSDGYPVVNPANISPQGLVAFENVTVDRETRARLSRHILKEDDIVFARRGELGRAALATSDQAGWVCGTGSLVVRLSGPLLRPAYLVRLLQTSALKFYFDTQAVGSTMANLNTSILLAMPLLLPPIEDQSEVLQQCDKLEDQFRHGEAALKRSQELLEERKRSLITAAVTGEFDVSAASSRAVEVALSGVGGGL